MSDTSHRTSDFSLFFKHLPASRGAASRDASTLPYGGGGAGFGEGAGAGTGGTGGVVGTGGGTGSGVTASLAFFAASSTALAPSTQLNVNIVWLLQRP